MYEWAVGTSPGGEDVQPFMSEGIIHSEEENVAGDGLIDKIPSDQDITSGNSLYQTTTDSLTAQWTYNDTESGIERGWYSVGTYPFAEDIASIAGARDFIHGFQIQKLCILGKPNIISVWAENKAGLVSEVATGSVIIDKTPPEEGFVSCPDYVGVVYQYLPNNQRVISCPEHTTINVHDVWSSMRHGCPAYNQIHKIYIRNFKIQCEGGVDCTIYNNYSFNILSLYFRCEGISTSLTNPIDTDKSFSRETTKWTRKKWNLCLLFCFYRNNKNINKFDKSNADTDNPIIQQEIEQSSTTSRTTRLSREMESLSSVFASTEITISEGNALTDKEKKPFPGKCITIANDTTGIIKCGPSQHIHMEKIWLGNNTCLSPGTVYDVYKTTIQNITCKSVSICTVPFFSGCLSVPPNNQRVISCPEHTTINVHDVWSSIKHGCPAYNQIHKIYIRNFKIHCEGGVDCTIYNRHSFNISSLYFHCEGISTSLTNPMMIQTTPSFSRGKGESSITSITTRPSREMQSLYSAIASTEITIGVAAGAVAAGIIILFIPFAVFLYRRRYRNSIQKPRRKLDTRSNPTYESEIDVKIDYSQNLNMESSIYTEPVELENDQDIVRTPHDYVNTDNITYDYARESNYLKSDNSENMEQEVGGTYQTKEMNYNTYSHLQDTFIDSDDTTYDHAIHNRIIEMSENDYCVSRCQMSDDDYDVSGNHNRSNHMDSSNNIYN
ncbi:unnamed protein product [Mytilus edulis]|uniref:Uncharacterized protein n=1 Tax=Mytilus edulis TaxID=6550 RepID=A0A8S3UZT8_MYTED|nr:unnamed protein product [Mytilus edulis]